MWRTKKGQNSLVLSLVKPYLNPKFTTQSIKTNTSKTSSIMSKRNVDESDVGIFCYISQLPGFRGILKQRYSDFIVNEVDLDGNVVHLTSLDASAELVMEEEVKVEDQACKSYESEIELFRGLAGDSDAELLKGLVDRVASGDEESASPIVLSPSSDKSKRTVIHNFFKEHLKFLVTDTVDGPEDSSKCIRVRLNVKGADKRGGNSRKRKDRGGKPYDSRGAENWPEHFGKFLRFNLCKENKDTQEALGVIGKMLGLPPRSFGFAGTKDKRSVSTQRVTIYKKQAARLAALNKRLIGIKVGDFCYVKEGLVLGQLSGNRFTITLRGVVADSEDTIKAAADSLGKHGFINYFGLQRFGSGSVPTHVVGATLVRGEWKTAVSMILDPREGERDAIQSAREYYKGSGDIEGALRQFPRNLVAERAILLCLKKCPGNFVQALKAIPRTLRMMFIHSYQSYLWNHAASMRMQKYGIDKVVAGDLVYCNEDNDGKGVDVLISERENEDGNGTEDCNDLDDISATELPEVKFSHVKTVTDEDVISGKYTIEDVILPMPGSRVIYPANEIAKVYHELAEKDSISLTNSTHNVKEFSLTSVTGSYRKVFQKPKDFEWELLSYTDGNVPLAETDMDKILRDTYVNEVKEVGPGNGNTDLEESKYTLPRSETEEDTTDINDHVSMKELSGNENEENPAKTTSDGIQRALKLSFTLPASCYATMAIRELLKASTSVAFHKSLN